MHQNPLQASALKGEKREKTGFTAGWNTLEEAVRGNSPGDEIDRVMVRQPFAISFKLPVMSVLIWRMFANEMSECVNLNNAKLML